MTNEQILELAKTCGFRNYIGDGFECFEDELLKFAREIRAQSFADGYDLAVMDYIRDEQYFALRTTSND